MVNGVYGGPILYDYVSYIQLELHKQSKMGCVRKNGAYLVAN
jgi:hypothetical protein